MAVTNTGTRGEPQLVGSGSSPTFVADVDDVSSYFAARAIRDFATVAAMVGSTGSGAGEWARVDAVPGALYYTDGTRWYLFKAPAVANATALGALFSGTCQPTLGLEVYQADIAVTVRWNGTAWRNWNSDWITYTVTFSPTLTLGSGGTQAFKYRYENGEVHVRGSVVLGTSPSMSTTPTINLPVNAAALLHAYQTFPGATKHFQTSGTQNYAGSVCANNTSVSSVIIRALSGSGSSEANITPTVPFTWAATNAMDIDFMYDPA